MPGQPTTLSHPTVSLHISFLAEYPQESAPISAGELLTVFKPPRTKLFKICHCAGFETKAAPQKEAGVNRSSIISSTDKEGDNDLIRETARMAGGALHYATKLNVKRHVYRLSLPQLCSFLFYYLCKCIKTNGKKLRHSKKQCLVWFLM